MNSMFTSVVKFQAYHQSVDCVSLPLSHTQTDCIENSKLLQTLSINKKVLERKISLACLKEHCSKRKEKINYRRTLFVYVYIFILFTILCVCQRDIHGVA